MERLEVLPAEVRRMILEAAMTYDGCSSCPEKSYIDLQQAIKICLTSEILMEDVRLIMQGAYDSSNLGVTICANTPNSFPATTLDPTLMPCAYHARYPYGTGYMPSLSMLVAILGLACEPMYPHCSLSIHQMTKLLSSFDDTTPQWDELYKVHDLGQELRRLKFEAFHQREVADYRKDMLTVCQKALTTEREVNALTLNENKRLRAKLREYESGQ